MAGLTNTQATLLGFLMEDMKTGWELVQDSLAGYMWFFTLTTSHVYRELKTLETLGYTSIAKTGPRGRKHFEITPAGRDAFKTWLEEPPGDDHMRFPFLAKLWFGTHAAPATIETFRTETLKLHRNRLATYRQIAERVKDDPCRRKVMEIGIKYEEAALTWLEELSLDNPNGV